MAKTTTKTNNKNAINVTVSMDTGLVVEKLQQFGPKLVRRSLRNALKEAGDVLIEAAKSKVPVESGDLRESIDKKVTTRMKMNPDAGQKLPAGKVEVGPRLDAPRHDEKESVGPGIYGMFVEFGLRVKKYTMRPFMRPAFDSSADKAIQVFSDKLKEGFDSMGKE